MESVGRVLLTNTTVCRASRLLQDDPIPESPDKFERLAHSMWGATRVYDLLCLIDAIVLHDQIYCLPGQLSDDVKELELRESLLRSEVVCEVPDSYDFSAVGKALLGAFAQTAGYKIKYDAYEAGHAAGEPISFTDHKRAVASMLGIDDPQGIPSDLFRGFEGAAIKRLIIQEVASTYADSFTDAAHEVIALIRSGATGADQCAGSDLRAMFYVLAAEHLGIPYWPSAYLQGMADQFPNYFTRSVRAKIYERLALTLRSSVDAVAEEFESATLFVPPFSAIVLDRAKSPEAIPAELMTLRQEYAGFRTEMVELERARATAMSISERLKIMRKIARLCREVSKPFDNPSPLSVESTLKCVPDIVALAANPSESTTWVNAFLQRPALWLVSWYQRRPVRKIIRTAEQVASLSSYGDLVARHFGHGTAERLWQNLHSLTQIPLPPAIPPYID